MTVSVTKMFWDHISKNRVVEKWCQAWELCRNLWIHASLIDMEHRKFSKYPLSEQFVSIYWRSQASIRKKKLLPRKPCPAFNMFTFITVYFILLSGPFSRLHKKCDARKLWNQSSSTVPWSQRISFSSVNKRKTSHLHQRACGLRQMPHVRQVIVYEWIIRKNNSLNRWILKDPKFWGTHLNRHEVVMCIVVLCNTSTLFFP